VWQGESLAGKTILIYPELGLGDSILFVRYAAALADRARAQGGQIILVCWDALETLFRRNSSSLDVLSVVSWSQFSKQIQANMDKERRTFLKSTLLSLPPYCRETVGERFPYLHADQTKVATWRERLSADHQFKVGLAWTGRGDHYRNALRTVPVGPLVEALRFEGVSLYSLQQSHPQETKKHGLIDLTAALVSLDDAAAFLCALDLVVCADVMVGHLGFTGRITVTGSRVHSLGRRCLRNRLGPEQQPRRLLTKSGN
jgi:hypothetical protein